MTGLYALAVGSVVSYAVAVLLPELVERQWYQYFLHNQRARILAASLLTQGTHRIVIVNVPWYLRKRR